MPEPIVRTRVWRNGALEAEDFPFAAVSDYLDEPDCLVWADILHPDEAMLASLAEELSLDPHAVEDASGDDERPKATRYASHLFMTTYAMTHDKGSLDLAIGRVSAFARSVASSPSGSMTPSTSTRWSGAGTTIRT